MLSSQPCDAAGDSSAAYSAHVPNHLGSSIALAAAIAFGFGAQSVARDIVERAYQRSGEVTSGGTAGKETGELDSDRPSAHPLQREE
jgi:hypothetical protein